MKNNKIVRKAAVLLAAVLAVTAVFPVHAAEDKYLPGVTESMGDPSYWLKDQANPTDVLADADQVALVNRNIAGMPGTSVRNLADIKEETFNGVSLNESITKAAESDAKVIYSGYGVKYAADSTEYKTWEEAREKMFGAMIDNCADPNAVEKMPYHYAVVTERTTFNCFPSDVPLLEDPADKDFDYRYHTALRVNEPLIVMTTSADGRYYLALSSCSSGWVAVEDVAVCESRDAWLKAWNIDPAELLVVYDDTAFKTEADLDAEASAAAQAKAAADAKSEAEAAQQARDAAKTAADEAAAAVAEAKAAAEAEQSDEDQAAANQALTEAQAAFEIAEQAKLEAEIAAVEAEEKAAAFSSENTADTAAAPAEDAEKEPVKNLLTMGTCLEAATAAETASVADKAAGYVAVWIPVRGENGSYGRELGFVAEDGPLNKGYFAVTAENIATIALKNLGSAYGWGGANGANDCSGYVRDVYKCFGIELARNTTGQGAQPVAKYDLAGLSDAEKAAQIKKLPIGAVLFFQGHEMIYLGSVADKLYVISSVSSIVLDGKVEKIRSCVISTLDTLRANGHTWLQDVHTAELPYTMTKPVQGSQGQSHVSQEPETQTPQTQAPETQPQTQAPQTQPQTQAPEPQTEPVSLPVVIDPDPVTEPSSENTGSTGTTGTTSGTGTTSTAEEGAYKVTLQKSSLGTVTIDKTTANAGDTVTMTVKPGYGYRLNELKVVIADSEEDVQTMDDGAGTFTFEMPEQDVVVKPDFVKSTSTTSGPSKTTLSSALKSSSTTSKTTGTSSAANKSAVKTGDTTNIAMWVAVAAVCFGGAAVLLRKRFRKV